MNAREHARWGRALLKACGGLDKAAYILKIAEEASKAAGEDRKIARSTSQLSNYQNADAEHFASMPAEVIQILEEDLGRKIYSRALFEYGGEEIRTKHLREAACEAAETSMSLQREVRLATADGKLTPNEVERLAAKHREAAEDVREVGQLIADAS